MVGYLHPCPHRMLQEHNMTSPARTNELIDYIAKFTIQPKQLWKRLLACCPFIESKTSSAFDGYTLTSSDGSSRAFRIHGSTLA